MKTTSVPQWLSEFPDYGTLPEAVAALLASDAIVDGSWSQDVCPCFWRACDDAQVTKDGTADGVRVLWCDYEDAEKREVSECPRFRVFIGLNDVFSTNDINKAIAVLLEGAA